LSDQARDRKTEEPTSRKLRKAREEGGAPISRDVSAACVLLIVIAILWFRAPEFQAQLTQIGEYGLKVPNRYSLDTDGHILIDSSKEIFLMLMWICLPIAVGAALVAVAVNFAQARGLFAPKAIAPQGERINPVSGAKRLFSLRSTVELGKSVLKIIALGVTLFLVIQWAIPKMVIMPSLNVDGVMQLSGVVFAIFFSVATAILMLIALFDVWFQHVNFIRDNRMTREEVKRERRDDQGDPHMRAHRRQLSTELASDNLLDRTARASLVIHGTADKVAVALFVDRDPEQIPWLLNKGSGHVADGILSVARRNKVRIVQDPRLAKEIIMETAIDSDIPTRLSASVRGFFG